MGPYTVCVGTAMKSCVIALAFVAIVFSAPTVEDDISPHFEMEMVQDETAANLNNMVAELKKVAPAHLQGHVDHMAEHAELIQEGHCCGSQEPQRRPRCWPQPRQGCAGNIQERHQHRSQQEQGLCEICSWQSLPHQACGGDCRCSKEEDSQDGHCTSQRVGQDPC